MMLAQALPDWLNETLFRWIASQGLGVVFVVLLLALVVGPLFLVVRVLISSISSKADELGHQISGAVLLFSGTLSTMSGRQEQAADHLADAISKLNATQAQTNILLAGLQKSQDITLRFVTENMVQLVQHRERIEGDSTPITGVVKSVQAATDAAATSPTEPT